MSSKDIPIGARFGYWTVTGPYTQQIFGEGSSRQKNYVLLYPCRCDCGTEKLVRAFKLLSNSRSCGCKTGEQIGNAHTKHGYNRVGKRERLYRIWDGMIQRCTNPNHDAYHLYGNEGITVYSKWRDFDNFREWAESSGYEEHLQLDRESGRKGYSPDNCRWATTKQQSRNKKTNKNVTAFGETKCVTDWALDPRCTITPNAILNRIEVQGMTSEDAIIRPRQSRKASPRFKGHRI